MHTSDFPDWLEEKNIGVQLIADQRTNEVQLATLKAIQKDYKLLQFYNRLHSFCEGALPNAIHTLAQYFNKSLNAAQQNAVGACMQTDDIVIIHGPPGTGKTTTLVELVQQLVQTGKKVLVSAPSNTAVDNIAMRLAAVQVPFLRAGNNVKVREELIPYTIEWHIENSNLKKTIKNMRIQSEQLRKMATQYKRNFGKDERDQRKLLLQEVKNIRKKIRRLQQDFERTSFDKHPVVLATPIGLHDCEFQQKEYDSLILDEAGQCLEPLTWTVVPFAKQLVLAGDPYQLPPTVISEYAQRKGLNISLLERVVSNNFPVHLLDTQYRMESVIAEFSNRYFYKGLLKSNHSDSDNQHIFFYDSAGAYYSEQEDEITSSLYNDEELLFVQRLITHDNLDPKQTVFITPYNGQLYKAKEQLQYLGLQRLSTIDSFQGQEAHTIILSLVRSNNNQQIGFLKDYRRVNVAMTRAQHKLYIIGDSITIGADAFYNQMIQYFEEIGAYHSVFEIPEL